jgi:alpha-tubulin suppressor-like RCC1 family protein
MTNRQRSPNCWRSVLLVSALSLATSCDRCDPSRPVPPDASAAFEGVPFNDVVLLAAGNDETCVVVASGATYCAGGSLEGYNPKLSMARRVAGADHTTQISIGESACAVQESGQVVCWSESRNEVLPRKRTGKKFEPDVIPGLPPTSYVLASEAAVPYWALARNDGSAWQWGGTTFDQSFVAPTRVEGLTLKDPVQVASNHNFFCARLRAGGVTCWDWQGYLNEELVLSVKEQFPLGSAEVVDIAVSYASLDDPQIACVLDIAGRATCWHYVGEFLTIPEPFQHPFSSSHRWKDIALGSEHSCGVERDGTVWCTGRNRYGQLGLHEPRDSAELLKVPGVVGAKTVAVGHDHSCALLRNGSVVCWGSNFFGQCGAPERARGVAPTQFLRFVGTTTGS